jgi:hypothetical protein
MSPGDGEGEGASIMTKPLEKLAEAREGIMEAV